MGNGGFYPTGKADGEGDHLVQSLRMCTAIPPVTNQGVVLI